MPIIISSSMIPVFGSLTYCARAAAAAGKLLKLGLVFFQPASPKKSGFDLHNFRGSLMLVIVLIWQA